MWTIFKVCIEFVIILLLFYVLTRDRTCTPCIGRRSLNIWTAREVPIGSILLIPVVSRIVLPKNDHALILRTCEYGDICGKRDASDVTKSRTLRCGHDPGFFGWAPRNHRVLIRRRQGGQRRCDDHNSTRRTRFAIAALKMEEEATSQGTQAASRNWKRQGN